MDNEKLAWFVHLKLPRDIAATTLFHRAKTVGQMLTALGVFVLVSLVPWLIAANAAFLSRSFYQKGWKALGMVCQVFALSFSFLTSVATMGFLAVWLFFVVQAIRGKFTLSDINPASRGE